MSSPFLPLPFYPCCLVAATLGIRAWMWREHGWGMPIGVVIATASVWFVGTKLAHAEGSPGIARMADPEDVASIAKR